MQFVNIFEGVYSIIQSICFIRPKNRCVSANMPNKIRVGRSENLFIFLQIFI